jgi:tetratricopeptide (TPR) repeat protein
LIQEKKQFKESLYAIAVGLNNASKFKEASAMFYSLYLFDPKNGGKALNNAAILAVSSNDYKLAERMYEELLNSEYMKSGVFYFATNKANDTEEEFNSREERTSSISLGFHEKPRDVKVSTTKPDVLKILAILYTQNGNMEKAKATYAEARKLSPNDEELKKGEFDIYFNSGYSGLAEDDKLVTEINNSRSDKKKYDELMLKRKEMFAKSLPDFEKAYSINPNDANTKNILKLSYEITGQPEKAKAIN